MTLTQHIGSATKNSFSYHLKHAVETWYGEYISNGAFILAAINRGCQLKVQPPNAYFNLKKVPSVDSCKRFLEDMIKKDQKQLKGLDKASLWKEYRYYCKQKLHFCPHIKKEAFFEFLSLHLQFNQYGYIIGQHILIPTETSDREDSIEPKTYLEGASTQIAINQYERNQKARDACITYYGVNCSVCGFNFEHMYGQIGSGYIHVHHITLLSEIGEEYEVEPQKDLRPVCPNCHAMLHKRKPPYLIEELRDLIDTNQ